MRIMKPRRVKHTYMQILSAPPATVFPLLCPVREMEWVRGWKPSLVISNSGVAEADGVFVMPGKPSESIWVITQHEPEDFQLEMVKVTPRHTVGKLEISLEEYKGKYTKAQVAYTYTSLGPAGDEFVKDLTEANYQAFMKHWESELNHFLKTGERLPEN